MQAGDVKIFRFPVFFEKVENNGIGVEFRIEERWVERPVKSETGFQYHAAFSRTQVSDLFLADLGFPGLNVLEQRHKCGAQFVRFIRRYEILEKDKPLILNSAILSGRSYSIEFLRLALIGSRT